MAQQADAATGPVPRRTDGARATMARAGDALAHMR